MTGTVYEMVKLHYMDNKYPHFCFNPNCEEPLEFMHAFKSYKAGNLFFGDNFLDEQGYRKFLFFHKKHDYDLKRQFRRIWKSEHVKFFCCACFNDNVIDMEIRNKGE